MKNSIKIKSTAFLAVLLLLTVGILSYMVLRGIKSNQRGNYEKLLYNQAKMAELYVNQIYAQEKPMETEKFLKNGGKDIARQIGMLGNIHILLYNIKGEPQGDLFSLGLNNDIQDTLSYSLKGNTAYQIKEEVLDYFAPIYIDGSQIGAVQLTYSLEEDNKFYKNILRLFEIIGSFIFLISFIIGYIYFNKLSADILRLKEFVENIKQGLYGGKLSLKRKDELQRLNEGIYFMSNEIQENIKNMEEEKEKLSVAVEKMRLLEKQQKHFINNITHEFKTPLTVIKAYIDLMSMYPEDLNLAEEAKVKIDLETQRLYDMVDKVLNIAALEKYDFECHFQEIKINELIEDICSRMEGRLKKFDINLNISMQQCTIWADKESINQIFINLMDNAIKYNKPRGEINIKVYTGPGKAYIDIENTGQVIPKEVGEKIFEAFYRVDRHRSRETGGAGLGLALVKRLVELQNGNIELIKENKHKTAFRISFSKL